MDTYIDEKYAIMNGSLISCSVNSGEDLFIPSQVNGHAIKRIGAGCSVGKKTVTVKLAEGIEEIGSAAFSDSLGIRKYELPTTLTKCDDLTFGRYFWSNTVSVMYLRRSLSAERYDMIRKNSIPLADGRMLVCAHRDMPEFAGIYSGFAEIRAPFLISKEMLGLNFERNSNQPAERLEFKREFLNGEEAFGISDRLPERVQKVKRLIAESPVLPFETKSETEFDTRTRMNTRASAPTVILAHYREKEIITKDETYIVNFHLRFGRAYWDAVRRVTYSGRQYFVYSKMYLSPNESCPYIEEQYWQEVYDAAGNPVGGATAKNVGAKVRLLSLLA